MTSRTTRFLARTSALLSPLLSCALAARAQAPLPVSAEVFVNSETENYLRLLQVAGKSPLYPWSIRSLSEREVERIAPADSLHPWSDRLAFRGGSARGPRVRLVRPSVQLIYNERIPYGVNDGPVWAGRGVTTVLQGGVAARLGPVSLTASPIFFRAENQEYDLAVGGLPRAGKGAYFDLLHPLTIDLPQRFGDQPYQRVHPGQSTLRVDLPFVTAGLSTADQHWGPAMQHPLLLGNNGGGFPHLFLGTGRPTNLWVGKLHGRLVWGRPGQSDYSPAPDSLQARFVSGMVLSFTPRGLPGLELGAARFFHDHWPAGGLVLSDFTKPFEALLTKYLPVRIPGESNADFSRQLPDNQLASVFARWVLPESGFEVYGELAREDRNFDFRDLMLEPDQQSSYMLGLRKVWSPSPSRLVALRGELANGEISHLIRVRQQLPFYVHHSVRQGHTVDGQLLGSPAVYGGQGTSLGVDYYHSRGRWTLDWSRAIRTQWASYWDGNEAMDNLTGIDAIHTVGASGVLLMGRFELSAGLRGVHNFNRNFLEDVSGANVVLGVRAALP